MDRQILNFTANEQMLTVDNPIRISTNKVNYIEAHFALGDNWSGYDSVRAVWFNDYQTISTVLDSQGVCRVPFEVMKRKGQVKVDLVGSISEGDVLTDRLTSYPVVAVVVDCVAPITGAETSPITPSQFEQYVAIVQALVGSVRDIDRIELNPDYTLTIYYSDGTSDTTSSIRGATGNGIASIAKTGSSGTNPVVDTYTVTYTGGNTFAFTVTNGKKGDTGATGATGPTGNGIQSIYKTGTSGLVDTYTILYTNGNTTTFEITNGQNGSLASTVLASTYSSSKTYAVGDYVYYSGNLYRCTTAITTAEAWTSGHWTQVALADDVSDLKSDLSDAVGVAQSFNITDWVENSYVDTSTGNFISYNNWHRSDYIEIGDDVESLYFKNNKSGAGVVPYNCFYDESKNMIGTNFNTNATGITITVPKGAKYFVVSLESAYSVFVKRNVIPLKDRATKTSVNGLNSEIEDINESVDLVVTTVKSENRLNPDTSTLGYALAPDGTIQASTTANTSDYIATEGATKLAFARLTETSFFYDSGYQAICQYDENKTFIGSRIQGQSNPISLLPACAYVRVSYVATDVLDEIAFNVDGITAETITEHFSSYKTAKVDTDTNKYSISSGTITIQSNKALFKIVHEVNAEIRQDVWRIKEGYLVRDGSPFVMWNGSDADGVVRLANESDFIGGYHGDEETTDVKLFVDGNLIDVNTDVTKTAFNSLQMYITSNLYHCIDDDSSSTITFKRNKIISFANGKLEVSNYWIAQSSLNIITAYMGMFSIARSLVNAYSTNADYLYRDNTNGMSWSQLLTHGQFETKYGRTIRYYTENGSDQAYWGCVQSYNGVGVSDRLKMYCAQISASNASPYALPQNGTIYAKSVLEII